MSVSLKNLKFQKQYRKMKLIELSKVINFDLASILSFKKGNVYIFPYRFFF